MSRVSLMSEPTSSVLAEVCLTPRINCLLSEWGAWSTCSCGSGTCLHVSVKNPISISQHEQVQTNGKTSVSVLFSLGSDLMSFMSTTCSRITQCFLLHTPCTACCRGKRPCRCPDPPFSSNTPKDQRSRVGRGPFAP